MIEKTLLKGFIGEKIILVTSEEEHYAFRRGTLIEITDNALVLEWKGEQQIYSLDFLLSVKRDKSEDGLQ